MEGGTWPSIAFVVPTCPRGHRQLGGRGREDSRDGVMEGPSRGSADAGDVGPDLESLGPGSPVLIGGDVSAAEVKGVVDRVVRRKEALRLSRRFEALHLPLASSCRLVGILGPVVEPLMPAMFDARHEILLGCGIAGELVRDHYPRRAALPLQQLAQQSLGGVRIT